jgi:hypothetical protein
MNGTSNLRFINSQKVNILAAVVYIGSIRLQSTNLRSLAFDKRCVQPRIEPTCKAKMKGPLTPLRRLQELDTVPA